MPKRGGRVRQQGRAAWLDPDDVESLAALESRGGGGQVPVKGVTGNEGPKMLLDVCHDLVGSTNAAGWPHEYGVAQNAGGQHRRPKSEKSAWVCWFVAVVATKERKCGKRAKERRGDGWGGRQEPKAGEGSKRSGLKLKTSKKGVGGKEGEKGVRVDGRELGGRGEEKRAGG